MLIENQEKLRSEMTKMENKKQSKSVGGAISVFSLGSASSQYRSQQEVPLDTPDGGVVTDTTTSMDEDSSSVVKWIGSWIGWK